MRGSHYLPSLALLTHPFIFTCEPCIPPFLWSSMVRGLTWLRTVKAFPSWTSSGSNTTNFPQNFNLFSSVTVMLGSSHHLRVNSHFVPCLALSFTSSPSVHTLTHYHLASTPTRAMTSLTFSILPSFMDIIPF